MFLGTEGKGGGGVENVWEGMADVETVLDLAEVRRSGTCPSGNSSSLVKSAL